MGSSDSFQYKDDSVAGKAKTHKFRGIKMREQKSDSELIFQAFRSLLLEKLKTGKLTIEQVENHFKKNRDAKPFIKGIKKNLVSI